MNNETIPVLTTCSESDGVSSMFPGAITTKIMDFSVSALQGEIKTVLAKAMHLFEDVIEEKSKFSIDTVSISLSISGQGKVSFIGEIGTSVSSAITVTFKKKTS